MILNKEKSKKNGTPGETVVEIPVVLLVEVFLVAVFSVVVFLVGSLVTTP